MNCFRLFWLKKKLTKEIFLLAGFTMLFFVNPMLKASTHSLKDKIKEALGTPFTYADMCYAKPDSLKWQDFLASQASKGNTVYTFGTNYEKNSGFIVADPKGNIFIAFKGTNSYNNALTDMKANWAYDKNTQTRVHNGFLTHYRAFEKNMLSQLKAAAGQAKKPLKDLKISITGHSLGGGIANYAALRLKKTLGLDIVKVVTFAAPIAFDRESAKVYDDKLNLHAITHTLFQERDPVTFVGGLSPVALATGLMAGPVSAAMAKVINSHAPVGTLIKLPQPSDIKETHVLRGYKKAMEAALKDPNYEEKYSTLKKKAKSTLWGLKDKAQESLQEATGKVMHTVHKTYHSTKESVKNFFGFGKK